MIKNLRMFEELVSFIRKLKGDQGFIPLHAPVFNGNERNYVLETIDSTFVSSVGKFVDRFEEMICEYTGSKFAVATVNGTAALHMALIGADVSRGEEVITQPLSFVATANAISYCGAIPVFIDVDLDTLGMSPESLESFLKDMTFAKNGVRVNKSTGSKIAAVVPMHTFGFACRIREIGEICAKYNIPLVEDSAESIGTKVGGQHTGTFGKLGIFSLNGNKTITSGGGGAIITNDVKLGKHLKHLTTTAKIPHKWEYRHDAIGYNYRMPNINAALACAQLEQLDAFLISKRELAESYKSFFNNKEVEFITEIEGTRANYWLNTIKLKNKEERDEFLSYTNAKNVMTRPIWHLLNDLDIYKESFIYSMPNAKNLSERVVNLPSSL